MSKDHRLKTRKQAIEKKAPPIAYLLKASDADLGEFQLARLEEVANLRKEMLALFDRIVDVSAQAVLAAMLRGLDRQALVPQLLEPATVTIDAILAETRAAIRDGQRSPEELIPRPSLPPGAAHLAASLRYKERNIAEGKCRYCPKPICHGSVDMCEEHLAKARARQQQKKGLSNAGSREYLYAGDIPSTHGRAPGTLQSLALNRQKKTRELLAEAGLPLDSVAVGVKAAREALLAAMPDKAHAMTQAELFEKASVITKTTGQRALNALLVAKQIQRIGKGGTRDLYRYFRG